MHFIHLLLLFHTLHYNYFISKFWKCLKLWDEICQWRFLPIRVLSVAESVFDERRRVPTSMLIKEGITLSCAYKHVNKGGYHTMLTVFLFRRKWTGLYHQASVVVWGLHSPEMLRSIDFLHFGSVFPSNHQVCPWLSKVGPTDSRNVGNRLPADVA